MNTSNTTRAGSSSGRPPTNHNEMSAARAVAIVAAAVVVHGAVAVSVRHLHHVLAHESALASWFGPAAVVGGAAVGLAAVCGEHPRTFRGQVAGWLMVTLTVGGMVAANIYDATSLPAGIIAGTLPILAVSAVLVAAPAPPVRPARGGAR